MSKVCGVIAEYDPLHNGHALHLRRAREITGADRIIVLMSGYVTQRGRFALFDPSDRAGMALECGADIVYTAPADITCRDAENYALAMVGLFHRTGCVDCICFGSEFADPQLLEGIADALDSPGIQQTIGSLIRSGLSYPRAAERALFERAGVPPGVMSSPNVILAVSYIRALKRLHSPMGFYPVQRSGDYHSPLLSPDSPSATAVRRAFLKDELSSAASCVPESVLSTLVRIRREKGYLEEDRADTLLFRKLLEHPPEALGEVCGCGEGIENRIYKEMRYCVSRDALTERACTTHFTKARLNRMLTRFLLGMPRFSPPEEEHLFLRGFRSGSSSLVKAVSQRITVYQDFVSMEHSGKAAAECRTAKMWNLCAGRPSSLLYSRGVIRKGFQNEGNTSQLAEGNGQGSDP